MMFLETLANYIDEETSLTLGQDLILYNDTTPDSRPVNKIIITNKTGEMVDEFYSPYRQMSVVIYGRGPVLPSIKDKMYEIHAALANQSGFELTPLSGHSTYELLFVETTSVCRYFGLLDDHYHGFVSEYLCRYQIV